MLKQVGPYRLEREVRSDVLTTVHEAVRAKSAGERVQIVIGKMPVKLSPEELERFEVEAQATRELPDAHLDHVIDHGLLHGMPYVVHPFIDSWSLTEKLEQTKAPIPPELTALIGRDVAKALRAAHERNPPLLHRRVSPHHVCVDETLRARLGGYAVAGVATRAAMSSKGLARIALREFAPEMLEERPLGPGADLFALGVVLVTALTGAPPPAGGSPSDRPIEELVPGLTLPPPLAALVVRLLRSDPRERGTADDAIHELSRCIADEDSARLRLGQALHIESSTLRGEQRIPDGLRGLSGGGRGESLDAKTKETSLPDALAPARGSGASPALVSGAPAAAFPAPPGRVSPQPVSPQPVSPQPVSPQRGAPPPAVAPAYRTGFEDDVAKTTVGAPDASLDPNEEVDTQDDPPSKTEETLLPQVGREGFFEDATVVEMQRDPRLEHTALLPSDEVVMPPTERTVQLDLTDVPSRGRQSSPSMMPPRIEAPEVSGPKPWQGITREVEGWPLPWLIALGMGAVFLVVVAAVIGIVLAS